MKAHLLLSMYRPKLFHTKLSFTFVTKETCHEY
jgi:hypothetical protein